MGVSTIEDRKSPCCLSPRIYQPSSQDMDVASMGPRKRKMFSSSSFYEEPGALYPTLQEQVQLCRRVAASLSDARNRRSRGADMFFRRVRRADAWVVAPQHHRPQQPQHSPDGGGVEDEQGGDPSHLPYVRPSGEGRLKLVLAPRPVPPTDCGDLVEHTAVSPEVCHEIVRGLHSPADRGGRLFARRKEESEDWVVDGDKVRHLLESRYGEALSGREVAQSVMRAAEAKVMTYPNAVPHLPVIESLDGPCNILPAAYEVRAPKGWEAARPASMGVAMEPPALPPSTVSAPVVGGVRRSTSFNNFNSSPRAWNAAVPAHFRPAAIRSVKPPSVLVQ